MNTYEIVQIRPDTWRIEDQGVRVFLLTGSKKALLIDSGRTLTNVRKIAESLTDLPLELLHTHADPDHVAGSGAFEWFYMHPSECVNFYRGGRTGNFHPVYEGDVLNLGARELEILALPGHTPGSITLLDRKYRALVGGDPIQDGKIFMFGPYRSMQAYIVSLEKAAGRPDFDEIYPSHGTCPVPRSIIGGLIAGARGVLAGEITSQRVDMFGNAVDLYDVGCAGFLCDPK